MSSLSWDDPLVQYGWGAFETMRSFDGQIPLLKWHKHRLEKALIHWGESESLLKPIFEHLYQRLQTDLSQGSYRLKLIIGMGNKGIIFHVYHWPYQKNAPVKSLLLKEQTIFKPQNYKSTCYVEHLINFKLAKAKGFDDAVYCDHQHNLLECSTSALLSYENGVFYGFNGPVLDSTSLASLVDRFPEKFHLRATKDLISLSQYPLLCINALHGISKINSIHHEGHITRFPLTPEPLISEWNRRLFECP
jgi:branched-subunit amino acid aminotransferase/4-amino-4-deoxychorismate lyase